MTNSTNKHERPEARGSDQYQVPGRNPVQRWHLLSGSPHQDCFSNDQTEQDPSSSAAVKHGPCLLTLKKKIQAFATKCVRNSSSATSKSGHPYPCKNYSQGHAEKSGRGSQLNCPSSPPDDPYSQSRDWTESCCGNCFRTFWNILRLWAIPW